jgi:hypothetical protein
MAKKKSIIFNGALVAHRDAIRGSLIHKLIELDKTRDEFENLAGKIKVLSDEKNILAIEMCRLRAETEMLQRELNLK